MSEKREQLSTGLKEFEPQLEACRDVLTQADLLTDDSVPTDLPAKREQLLAESRDHTKALRVLCERVGQLAG